MEHGGTVLNAAVMLDGNCPIEVVVKKVDEPVIVLASTFDIGAEHADVIKFVLEQTDQFLNLWFDFHKIG